MIFKWYARDFAAAGAVPLLPWLARYLPPAPAAALGRLLGDGGSPAEDPVRSVRLGEQRRDELKERKGDQL